MDNTTTTQDRVIKEASAGHIESLIEIIQDLDHQISEWKEATGYDDPKGAGDRINDLLNGVSILEDRITELEKELEASRS